MTIKWAELTNSSLKQRPPGRLKWGDIVLKRGAAPVDAFTIKMAPSGSEFTLEAQSGGDPARTAELNAAIKAHEVFDFRSEGDEAGTLKGCKVQAITIKQKVTRTGFGVEIALRKR